ncbi:MAG TPA: hypothetical protein DGM69_04705 [Chloroflexi bacterium]|nr:hypothetical protein [Chloroflexota bacterium]|tara:strand:- start:1489 stop:2637 length:1149 start_codon:yes stop_codon:yes gene_type:complete
MSKPKVVISSAGVFHAYHLARAVQQNGYLEKFITSIYNKYESGIDKSKVVQIPVSTIIASLIQIFPGNTARAFSYLVGDTLFDKMATKYLRDPDIFHVFNNQGLECLKFAKNRGATTIVSRSSAHPRHQFEILENELNPNRLESYINRMLIERHMKEYEIVDYIFVPSDFVWNSMIREGVSKDKLRRVHLGFDPDRFFPGKKKDDVFRIMYAGGLSKQKGINYLLEAYASLDLANSELLLVGDEYPDIKDTLSRYKGLYKHVRFVPQDKLVHYYQQSSVFVLPSLQDGFGMVTYEAAGCGLPLIVTKNVGADVRDKRDGFVIPVRDSNTLASKLMFLYDNPQLAYEMGMSARQYVQQFTWSNYYAEINRYYGEILAEKNIDV